MVSTKPIVILAMCEEEEIFFGTDFLPEIPSEEVGIALGLCERERPPRRTLPLRLLNAMRRKLSHAVLCEIKKQVSEGIKPSRRAGEHRDVVFRVPNSERPVLSTAGISMMVKVFLTELAANFDDGEELLCFWSIILQMRL